MNKYIRILTAILVVTTVACNKGDDGTTATPPPPPPPPPGPSANILFQGSFSSGAHTTSGTASIINDGGTKLYLENFKTDAGPDLYVYLSKTTSATSFISLGLLKGTAGNQYYTITGSPDFAQYQYVLIWCQQYSVLFGSAQLVKK